MSTKIKYFYYKPKSIFLVNVSTDIVPNQSPKVLIEIFLSPLTLYAQLVN
jgi:hypothetical protein